MTVYGETSLKEAIMTISTFLRICGLIAIVAGILNALAGFPDLIPGNTLAIIRRAADISVLIGIVGTYMYQRHKLGILGYVGFFIVMTGILMLIFSLNYEMAIGIYAVGLFVVGIATVRANVFPRWAPWLWIVAPLISIPTFLFPNIAQLLFQVSAIAFALGFVGVGYYMLTKPQASEHGVP